MILQYIYLYIYIVDAESTNYWMPWGLLPWGSPTCTGRIRTSDGRNPARNPVEVVGSWSQYLRRVLAPSKNGGWPWDFWTINSIISWAFDGFSTRGAIGVLQIVNYMACQDTSWHSVASITWRRQAAYAGYLEAQESLEIAQHESFWASKPGFPFQQIISGWCSPEM